MRASPLVLLLLAPTAAALSAPFPPVKSSEKTRVSFGTRRDLIVLSDDPAADLRAVAKAMTRTPCRFTFGGGASRADGMACESGWICPGDAVERAVDEIRNVVSVRDEYENPRPEQTAGSSEELAELIRGLEQGSIAAGGPDPLHGSCAFAAAASRWYQRYAREHQRARTSVALFVSFDMHRVSSESFAKAHSSCSVPAKPQPEAPSPAPLVACGRRWPAGFWEALFDDRGGCGRPSEWVTFVHHSTMPAGSDLTLRAPRWEARRLASCPPLPRASVPDDCKVPLNDVDLSVPDSKLAALEADLAATWRARRLDAPASGPSPAAILADERDALARRKGADLLAKLVDATLTRAGDAEPGRTSLKLLWCSNGMASPAAANEASVTPSFMNMTR